ncbi:hypothetical protein V6N12_043259 [Hibiscus sabdariffa]|uniref:Uncharacterized protein n=1 Tax=Hibiscus sabdariffa TaxID=183260 RepID=A0ABR2DDS2_9ROSI
MSAIYNSCSSTTYTRDQISIAFGDAYGNQIYAPRLDDPSSRAFERCSSDTFEINGPCAYQICYVYLYRTGPDGWKPETVKIYAYNSRAVTFYYNTFIPHDIWYGFNYCNSSSSSNRLIGRMSLLLVILWFVFYELAVFSLDYVSYSHCNSCLLRILDHCMLAVELCIFMFIAISGRQRCLLVVGNGSEEHDATIAFLLDN